MQFGAYYEPFGWKFSVAAGLHIMHHLTTVLASHFKETFQGKKDLATKMNAVILHDFFC